MAKKEKPLYMSKTVWGAAIAGFGGLITAIGSYYGFDVTWVPEVLIALGGVLGVTGLRDALRK